MSHLVSMRVGIINLGRAPLHGCKLELGHANGTRKLQTQSTDRRTTGHPRHRHKRRKEDSKVMEKLGVFEDCSSRFTYQQPR
jgi:hypothetical protein